MSGTLVLVVGPSGAGKDTLIDGARDALSGDPRYVFPRRAITRPHDAGGERHEAISRTAFLERLAAGGFMLHWNAHGLDYGVPASCETELASGRHVVANVSRGIVHRAITRYSPALVLEVTAPAGVLAARLSRRRRETPADMARRLARPAPSIPDDARHVVIVNEGTVQEGVERFVDALHRGTQLHPSPFVRKTNGATLDCRSYREALGDIVAGRFDDGKVADFLAATAATLTRDETVSLARARIEFAQRMTWEADLVADKHSMGGIPGSRITPIVVPIVAAHGLTIPKASSRAITSPAGTADAMEVLARVDLDADAVRRVVRETNGCIVWNGRLTHSRVDDVMNAITRPRRIDSLAWSVASILSKKLAVGATHCAIDVPVGPTAKVRGEAAAMKLRDLFLHVGATLGLKLDIRLTNGNHPVGRGVGPALEARDALAVLRDDAGAPSDLREKALEFAAAILRFDPAMTETGAHERARELLDGGAAHETLQRMISAQGPVAEAVTAGRHATEVAAGADGVVEAVDCFRLAGIARAAGAPADKGAGLDLMARPGDRICRDAPLYRIHAGTETGLAAAAARASVDHAFRISPPAP